MEKGISIGVDIGGTKVAAALVNKCGEILSRVEYPTVTDSRELLFEVVLRCIYEVLEVNHTNLNSIQGIGVGVPGKVDIENGIAIFQNNIPWNNFPLVENLKKEFGHEFNIIIDNDVKMAAYAEYNDANIGELDLFSYVTISTGIGATSILNNQIIRGSGFSGEIGFIPIKFNDKYSTAENVASGPAIQKMGQKVYHDPSLITKEIFDRYYMKDNVAKKIIENSAHHIALSLYSIICVLDPKKIVLGGSVVTNNHEYVILIKRELSKFLVEEQEHILDSLAVSELASDNGVIGAGLVVFE